jgi:pimeloyl-ACP methyl ester carboxylesterase
VTVIETQGFTRSLAVPGAALTYDVRAGTDRASPPVFMIGSPMGAAGFGTLSRHFKDRTVVTYDPRGVERSGRTDGAAETTPVEHAEDLHRIIAALDLGPVDMFASSGGAVNALVLVSRHPDDVRTLVAHEPPAARYVPDHEAALAVCRDIHETYLREGLGAGMARFIMLVGHQGEITRDWLGGPAPDPAMFGLPAEDDGSRGDPLLGQNLISSTHVELDFGAIETAPTRVIIAVGAESGSELARRSAEAVAERLGIAPTVFPGGHAGFLGGEYGQTGQPEAFAATLRGVIG